MSYSVSDRVRELCTEIIEGRGLSVDEGYVDYLTDLAEVVPIGNVLAQVGREDYESFCRDQAVEARVEALER